MTTQVTTQSSVTPLTALRSFHPGWFGAVMGTALAFMMAVVGVSFPETILLRRVLKPQLIALFIGIVTVAIIITGYLFNLVL